MLAWLREGAPRLPFLRQLTEVRQIVEPAAAGLAATRATATEIEAIARAYGEMEAAVAAGDVDAFVRADMRFHGAILQACRNELLDQMSRTVYSALAVSFQATTRVPGSAKAALPRHRAILEAIRARRPARVSTAMTSASRGRSRSSAASRRSTTQLMRASGTASASASTTGVACTTSPRAESLTSAMARGPAVMGAPAARRPARSGR